MYKDFLSNVTSLPPLLMTASVTIVDIDSGDEENLVATSQGASTGLNLKEGERIYFGGLPSTGNFRCAYQDSLLFFCPADHSAPTALPRPA